jgi:hypothetical protein
VAKLKLPLHANIFVRFPVWSGETSLKHRSPLPKMRFDAGGWLHFLLPAVR